jgi:hypothetical protein
MEARSDVLDRIAATNPLPADVEVDPAAADRLLASVVATSRRSPGSARRRRIVVAAVALAVAAVAAPALAFNEDVRSFLGLRTGPPALQEARLLVSAPVAEGTVAHLWIGNTEEGGECFFETFAPPGEVEAPKMGGGICSIGRPMELQSPLSLHVSIGKRPLRSPGAASWVPPLISGRLDPNLGAVRVELEWTGGSKELAHANGFFLGAEEALYQVPAELLPLYLVAYDSAGGEVHRHRISADWFRLE